MSETETEFAKWLALMPEEDLIATLREQTCLAAEYAARAEEVRNLIALRRRLAHLSVRSGAA